MGKRRIIAETGAGQHGVATATVCALLGLECVVYMGSVDVERQALNVFRMELLGAEVRTVASGTATLKDAINEAFRIAERRLLDIKEKRVDREKMPAHDAESQSLGQIAEVNADQDFGFLMTKEGGLLYFHRNAVISGDFDHLSRGEEVHYNEDVGDTGPIATKVRVKERR